MAVEFNEENSFQRPDFQASETPKIAAMLIKWGIAKDESSANKVQVIGALVLIAIAIFLVTR